MRIAIVDDISEDRLILRSEINAYFQEKSGDTTITFEEFPSGEALLSAFVPGHFQIVFFGYLYARYKWHGCSTPHLCIRSRLPAGFLHGEPGICSRRIRRLCMLLFAKAVKAGETPPCA